MRKFFLHKLNFKQTFKVFLLIFLMSVLVVGGGYFYFLKRKNHSIKLLAELDKTLIEIQAKPLPQKMMVTNQNQNTLFSLDFILDQLTKPINIKGLELIESGYKTEEIDTGIIEKKVKLTLKGSFSDIGFYIENIENFLVPFRIKHFSIESINDDTGLVLAKIEGSFFGIK